MRRLWLPGLCSLVVLGLLVFLGTWQVRRGAWKRAVLADIAAAEVLPAIDMPEIPVLFTKVRVEGMLRFDRAALYGAEGRDIANQPVMGAQLVVPLDRPGHPPLLVLLGWVAALPASMTVTPATIEGYIRAPETAGPFAAADDPAGRRFYTLDPHIIATALGMPNPAPMILVALGPLAPPPAPDPAHSLPRPSDNHMAYAITWFGLAAGLIGVFIAFARKVLRS